MATTTDASWIQTFTGRKFHTLNPFAADVDIKDIAHALSLQCRFSGHTKFHYSVAQHSVLLSGEVPVQDALWGLLHDASEAYLVDLPRPIKKNCALGAYYQEVEGKVMKAICTHFNMHETEPQSVKEADARMLTTEKRDLMVKSHDWSHWLTEPYEWEIDAWIPIEAEGAFLRVYHDLTGAL